MNLAVIRNLTLALAAAIALATAAPAQAQVLLDENPAEAAGVKLEEQRGAEIPRGLTFTDSTGETVEFDALFDGERPVVLILGYYDCPLLCPWVFNSMQNAFNQLAWQVGKEYRVVAVSIDPTNTTEQAASERRKAVEGLRRGVRDDQSWMFLLSPDDQVVPLAEAVGFGYSYLEESGEYAHPGVAIILSPEGVVTQYLQVSPLPEKQLRLSLMEAADGQIGSFIDKFIFSCHIYDPDAGSFVLHARSIMNVGAVLTAIAVGLVIGGLLLKERLSRRGADTPTDPDAGSSGSPRKPRGLTAAAE
jgi:protein SCO1/2